MRMTTIVPDLDAYGSRARLSALGDALEAQALHHRSLSISDLADYIRDSAWTRKLGEQFAGTSESEMLSSEEEEESSLGEEVDKSEDAASAVFALLCERQAILEEAYPFEVRGTRLVYRGREDLSDPYLVLLAITLVHSYGLALSFDPRYYFEELVGLSLSQRGLLVGSLAKERREGARFEDALEKIGEICRLRPSPSSAPYRRQAQDEGVDVVAHLSWGDIRPFHWVFLIQATCGKSETWFAKMCQPSIGMWKEWLGLRVLPKAILAVPHHIPHEEALYLAEKGDGQRLILDRLRLCRFGVAHAEKLAELVRFLDSLEVEFS